MEVELKQIQERRAEQAALPCVYGVSFTDCLRINGIATELEVGRKVIQAHRIYGAWNAFLTAEGPVTEERIATTRSAGNTKGLPVVKQPTALTDEAEHLVKEMAKWITTSYGEAYRAIKTDEEKEWLSTVIQFVVKSRIMENKYHQWITEGSGFVDEAVAHKMAEIYRFRSEMKALARLIHTTLLVHKDRDAEDWEKRLAEALIAGLFDLLRVDRLGALPPIEKKAQETRGKESV